MQMAQLGGNQIPRGWNFAIIVYPMGAHEIEDPHIHYEHGFPATWPNIATMDGLRRIGTADMLAAMRIILARETT
jgi:hypothetical protein